MNQLVISALIVVAGLVLGIRAAINGNLIVSLALFIAALYFAAGTLIGFSSVFESPFWSIIAFVVMLASIAGVFSYHQAFNIDLQTAYSEALTDMISAGQLCEQQTADFYRMREFGVFACAMQANRDKQSSLRDLVKARYFGPELTVLDGVYEFQHKRERNYCAEAFTQLQQKCPNAFLFMTQKHRSALIKAATD